MELHADFQLIHAFEHFTVQGGDQLGAVLAVGFFRLDGDTQFVANLLAFQGFFQTDDDVAGTLQVHQRSTAGGAVDNLTRIVGQGIVDGNRLVGCDLHGTKPI
ncbi:hypothetical protein D3C76_1430060 [compost metagenome]